MNGSQGLVKGLAPWLLPTHSGGGGGHGGRMVEEKLSGEL